LDYAVVEIFSSIQGEGLRSGLPTTFVRLAGCNLRCAWCDTPEALDPAGRRRMSAAEITAAVTEVAAGRMVVLTGGEPALQPIGSLIDNLRTAGFGVGIETNGTRPLPPGLDWVTLSPKPPDYHIDPGATARVSELKLVADGTLYPEIVRRLWLAVGEQVPVVLQPEGNRPERIAQILDWLRLEPRWRLGLQLHKVIGVP